MICIITPLLNIEWDYKLIVSLYAAIISTFVFFWKLYEFYHNNKGKLVVKTSIITQIITGTNNSPRQESKFLKISITNTGNNSRLINKPLILTDLKGDDKFMSTFTINKIQNYPIKLNFGEVHDDYIGIDAIEQLKKLGAKKYKGYVSDTLNKKYQSKWYKLK